ncbi:hypothetical protein QTG54_015735 [Skeletonema marinoi]|uniref:Uncharacterized protein n=1 Tax=Skeletonema marinoi TaxID=267567 RepID=A0AAD8XTR1_9STRA|nr:hypothetical protein QTG54_015735 [Skeletonema marinoi]
MRKEWLDPAVAVIRYPFDFDEEGRPTEALKQQCIITEAEGNGANKQIKASRATEKAHRKVDEVYGGVSVVFSGDFHRLKPICAEDDILYSDSDAQLQFGRIPSTTEIEDEKEKGVGKKKRKRKRMQCIKASARLSTTPSFLRVKLRKDGRERRWKNWEGKKVWAVSVDNVEWMESEHYPTPTGSKARTVRLIPQVFSATIKFPLTETFATRRASVNSNIATTGHKLQGISKDVLIVNDWNYRCANWGENTSWTLPHETIGPGAQLQCSTESHSLRATIEGQQRKLAGLPDPDMLDYYYQSTHHQSHNKLEWMIIILLETKLLNSILSESSRTDTDMRNELKQKQK